MTSAVGLDPLLDSYQMLRTILNIVFYRLPMLLQQPIK